MREFLGSLFGIPRTVALGCRGVPGTHPPGDNRAGSEAHAQPSACLVRIRQATTGPGDSHSGGRFPAPRQAHLPQAVILARMKQLPLTAKVISTMFHSVTSSPSEITAAVILSEAMNLLLVRLPVFKIHQLQKCGTPSSAPISFFTICSKLAGTRSGCGSIQESAKTRR